LGAIHAGISGVYGYPGTPSTEIFEYIEARTRESGDVHALWSTNEKVAYEEALGMVWAGKRALVTMKHVGLNVAADAFMNSGVTGVNGGLVVAVADDPGMHSSQNEQDSRYLAEFGMAPCFEPHSQQEAYEMTREAFEVSERFQAPVLVRLVTRLAHSRSIVEQREPRPQNPLSPLADWTKWTLLPSNARVQFRELVEKQPSLIAYSEQSPFNRLELRGKRGLITAGLALNYALENLPADHDWSHLHIGLYPLPLEKLRALIAHVEEILVLEDGYPFIERQLALPLPVVKRVRGKLSGDLPPTGELNPDLVRRALGLPERPAAVEPQSEIPARPPALCRGCGHADAYRALNEVLAEYDGAKAFSDIGCYTLGAYPPFLSIGSCVCMGASVGMATGAAQAGFRPAVAVIGDSTFTHGGITGLVSAVYSNTPVTIVILDNGTVAMTGTQDTLVTGDAMVELVTGLGVPREHVRVINPIPRNHETNVAVLREEIAHPGVSVVIARRKCLHLK